MIPHLTPRPCYKSTSDHADLLARELILKVYFDLIRSMREWELQDYAGPHRRLFRAFDYLDNREVFRLENWGRVEEKGGDATMKPD